MSDSADDRTRRLEEAERRLGGVLTTLPAIVWDAWDGAMVGDERVDHVSDYVETMTGYRVDEWLSQSDFWLSLSPPEDREKVLEDSREIIARGSGIFQHRWVTKDGRAIWVETFMNVAKNAAGAMLGVHGVTFDITSRKETEQRVADLLVRSQSLSKRLDALVASIPGIVWEAWGQEDVTRLRTDFVSDYVMVLTGYTREEWLGTPQFWMHILHPDDKERVLVEIRENAAKGGGSAQFRWITKDRRTIWVESYQRFMRDDAGRVLGVRGVTLDITARKQAEEEQARLQQEIIRVQAQTLSELSTPLIPISDEVLVMPLIGSLDRDRSNGVLQTLLSGISRTRARVAILDITGVPGLDTQSADAILRAAKAVQLLGAQVVLTGIRPEVAQTLVTLGADLSGIVTRGTLEDGIAFAQRPAAAERRH
jgi:PAS domain S-box-containing protein